MILLRVCSLLLIVACVGACGHRHSGGASGSGVASRGAYKVGSPYTIDGVTYAPREEFQHIETGVASWYGPGFHGKSTANGESYDQHDRTAAHRTLQMPSIVRVTNLDNGLSTVVRVNDRGPYARNRVIDLSRAAAQELDMVRTGTARVRIDQLAAESQIVKDVAIGGGGPAEQRDALAQSAGGRRGVPATGPVVMAAAVAPPPQQVQAGWGSAPPAMEAPAFAPAPAGPTIATLAGTGGGAGGGAAPVAGGYYVQTGAFSTPNNAERHRDVMRSYGQTDVFQGSAGGRDVYRVRLGPYTTQDAAGIVADRLKRSGYGDARVVAD